MTSDSQATALTLHKLARDALIHLWPLYEMRRARASTAYPSLPGVGEAAPGHRWCNVFAHRRELIRPGVSKIVTPNNDTLYSVAWLDLGNGPVVVDIPDMGDRYHVLGMLDSFTNPFAHLGTRLLPSGAKSILVSWPGCAMEEDAGDGMTHHVRSPSRWVWVIGRILVRSPEDLPAVHQLQDGLRIRPHGDGLHVPSQFMPGCDPLTPLDAKHFFSQVNAALVECAGDAALDRDRVRSFARLGFGAGVEPTTDQLETVAEILPSVRESLLVPRAARSASQWEHLPMLHASFGDDDALRAHVSLQYIGMVESLEAVYPMTWRDAAGEPLRGARAYALHFTADELPPVDAFWSLTIYDSATCQLVENELQRYAIGDRTPGLERDAKGGLEIRISHAAPPAQQQANWLPAPAGEFYLCLRAYLPREEILDGRYQLPVVRRV